MEQLAQRRQSIRQYLQLIGLYHWRIEYCLHFSEGRVKTIQGLNYREQEGLLYYLHHRALNYLKCIYKKCPAWQEILRHSKTSDKFTHQQGLLKGCLHLAHFNNWVAKYGQHKKGLVQYTAADLEKLLSQLKKVI